MIRDRIESMSSEGGDDSPDIPLHSAEEKNPDVEGENGIGQDSPSSNNTGRNNPPEQMQLQEDTTPKKSFCARCINKNLLGLKILLFIFYGGLGIVATWLNHSLLSKRFTEKETALVYGLASLLSVATPFIFGLVSDKSAQPKKVLAVSLLLAGLVYPLVLTVPTAVSYHYKEKFDWCRETGRNESSCLPFVLNCSSSDAELITDYGVCSEGCGGKLILTKCKYICDGDKQFRTAASTGRKGNQSTTEKPVADYDQIGDDGGPVAAAQISPREDIDYYNNYDGEVDLANAPPHICINSNRNQKYKSLCKVFDKQMKNIEIEVSGITGYTEINGDNKCHYPIHGYLDGKTTPQPLISCHPLSQTNCYITCALHWDHTTEIDQWVCQDDYLQWVVAFSIFLVAHTFGTMLVISAAALLNSAVVSMVHEHEHGGYLGFQLIYGALGFAIMSPLTSFLFQYFESDLESVPWELEYALAYSVWLIISAIIACTLPYNAEWVPKSGTIRRMLTKWSLRGQNLLFFEVLIVLGWFQGMMDVLSYYQIKATGGSLFNIGLGAAAAVAPAIIFIFRVEKVIEYCGYHNVLYIALVVISLQFTGYAYLVDVAPEWSYLLKGLDTFSVLMVWITLSLTTHNLAPRSLVATCQTIVVIFYCCIGRGIGGVLTYYGLQYLSKEYLLKTCATLSILFCILFLIIHYWCLKPVPYTKKFHFEKPAPQGTTGNYKPLKLVSKKDKGEDEADEL